MAAARLAGGRAVKHDELLPAVACFFAGIYGGYFGAAQGIILLATLGALLPATLARTNALKNVLALTVGTVAAVLFLFSGHVAWHVVLLIAAGSVVGAQVGARIGKRVPVPALWGFIVMLGLAVGVRLLSYEGAYRRRPGALTWGLGADRFGEMVDDLERLRFDSLWLSERATGLAPRPDDRARHSPPGAPRS